jgi:putative transferase (TIGR04331 family)
MIAADRYITVGWKINNEKVIQGGFICRDIKPYQPDTSKKNILFIARTNFPYLMEFDIYNAPNTKLITALKRVRDFCDLLPEALRACFVLRPRREDNFWNTEHSLEVKKKNIRVDTGNFSDSISNARIVIIDHISTGAAEILLMKVPCLIIQDEQHFPILEEIHKIFDELKRCGVMHNSAQSAVSHLANINENIQQWWNSEAVQTAVKKLISKTLAPPSKTIDYLLRCLKKYST